MEGAGSFYERILKKPWPYAVGGLSLGLLNVLLFLAWGAPWGITSGITYFTGWVSSFLGFSPQNWAFFRDSSFLEGAYRHEGTVSLGFVDYPYAFHFLAIIIGALLASLLAGEFRVRKWRSQRFVISALAGGFLMGYGARLALGCNIGAFFSAIPSLSVHGWMFGLFVLLGSYAGGKILLHYLVS